MDWHLLTHHAVGPGSKYSVWFDRDEEGAEARLKVGRLRLPDFLSNKGQMPSALVGVDESSVSGLFELVDKDRLQQRQEQ